MEIIVSNKKFNLSKLPTSIFLISSQDFDIDISNLTKEELEQFYFFGMPIKQIKEKNLSLSDLINFKHTLNKNIGLCLIYLLIQKIDEYNFFIINSIGIDALGVKYLIHFVNMLEYRKKKVFFVSLNT